MLLPATPLIFRKRAGRIRRPRRIAPPVALTLVAAAYDNDTVTLTLTFDRAIDIAGLVGGEIVVDDGAFVGVRYAANGATTILGPAIVRIELNGIGDATQAGVILSAGVANGIVAVDDGAAWTGVTDLEVPFPMNELAKQSASGLLAVSAQREVAIRVATMGDLPSLDALQKQHGRSLGYFPTKQFEGYIQMGAVLIAHDGPETVGYVISRDRYLKRDELGVVYQLCVKAGDQRKLIGATLVREVFNRSAYGCKLYCCWCAQDLPANHFWESMGFVPIAFRAGSTGKRRVHIFWQRRSNAEDGTTPYWYPSQTNGGAIREDRLVFPIPPGTHWTEVQAVAIPQSVELKVLSAGTEEKPPAQRKARGAAPRTPHSPAPMPLGGFRFQAEELPKEAKPKAPTPKPPKVKSDPQLVAKARELRDRWMEQVNAHLLVLDDAPRGKYDVSRALGSNSVTIAQPPLLPALPAA